MLLTPRYSLPGPECGWWRQMFRKEIIVPEVAHGLLEWAYEIIIVLVAAFIRTSCIAHLPLKGEELSEILRLEKLESGICRIEILHPPFNLLTQQIRKEVGDAFFELERCNNIKAVVFGS